MIIQPPTPDEVDGHAARMYADDLDADGFVFAHTQAMAVNPDAHAAFEALVHAVVPSIGTRVYELATLGAARAIPSAHCLLAHGRKSLRAGILSEAQLAAWGRGDDLGLDEADAAVLAYAAKLSTDPAGMTDDDTRRLREVGFSDRQIVDITLAAAARNYFSRALLALAVPLDDAPGIAPGLAAALLAPTREPGRAQPATPARRKEHGMDLRTRIATLAARLDEARPSDRHAGEDIAAAATIDLETQEGVVVASVGRTPGSGGRTVRFAAAADEHVPSSWSCTCSADSSPWCKHVVAAVVAAQAAAAG